MYDALLHWTHKQGLGLICICDSALNTKFKGFFPMPEWFIILKYHLVMSTIISVNYFSSPLYSLWDEVTRTENTNSYDSIVLFLHTYSTMRASMEKLTPSHLHPFLSVLQPLHCGSIKMETIFHWILWTPPEYCSFYTKSFPKIISGFFSNTLFFILLPFINTYSARSTLLQRWF